MLYNLLPHGSVFLAFYSSSNNQTAAISDRGPVKDTDWVLTGAASLPFPAIRDPGIGHTILACAGLNCLLDFVDYVTTVYTNLYMSVVVVFGF